MTVAELHGRWCDLHLEQRTQEEEALRVATEKRALFLAWLVDNPAHLERLRAHRSQRGVARRLGINHTYVARFEKGEISAISDDALNRLFSYYMELERAQDDS